MTDDPYRFHVKHLRCESRHRDEHEIWFYGERLATLSCPDEVMASYPSYGDVQHAVELAIRHIVLHPNARHDQDLPKWTGGKP